MITTAPTAPSTADGGDLSPPLISLTAPQAPG
jgi:hypothetical protein